MIARRRYHVSWIIACLSTGILLGAFLALYLRPLPDVAVLIGVIVAIIACLRRDVLAIICALIAGLLCGLWRAGDQLQAQAAFLPHINKTVEIAGRVVDDPTLDIDGDMQFKLSEVVIENQEISGTVWVSTSEVARIERSDSVRAVGLLNKGFGTIPAAMYRARIQKVVREPYADVGRDVRNWFAGGIRAAIDEPEASLGSGFLLGQKTQLPEKLNNNLRVLGLTHIVVASGYNLTILIRFARRLFARISRFSALALSGLFLYGFVQITGFSPSMSRASLIASLSLLAWYYGRAFHPFVLLPFSAAVTVWINPSYAWGDIGWLLSFLSFVGVIIIAPLLHAYFWGDAQPHALRQVFIETLAAQLATLPLIAYVFGQYSPLSLLANIAVVPLIPLAMVLVLGAGVGGVLLGSIAWTVGLPAEVLLGYMTTVVDKLAVSPLASAEIEVPLAAALAGYLIILIAIISLQHQTHYQFRKYNIVE